MRMYLAFILALLPFSGVWARNRALFTNVGRVERVDDGSPAFVLKGRFIQITDMHPDQFYLEGSLVRTACHRMASEDNSTATKPPKQKYNRTKPEIPDGEYGILGEDFDENDNRTAGHFAVPDGPCDSPWVLINATFEYIEKVWKDKIDFVVWTGDNVRHDNDNHYPRSPSNIFNSNLEIRDKFYAIFKHENPLYPLIVPIIPSYGNNDVWPHNIFAPGPNYQTRAFASLWEDMIPEYEAHTFERGGYFAVEVVPNKLAVLSLNTLYWFGSNAAVDGCDRKSEPGYQQFEWLRVQLNDYRKRGVKVYLTGHVPPGRKFYYPSCFRRYALWSHAFRDVILGHFYGHNNMDHFFLLDAKQALEEEEEAEMLKRILSGKVDVTTFTDDDFEILERLSTKDPSDILDTHKNDLTILGAEEYIASVKEMFSALPGKPNPKKWKKGKKGEKQRKKWEKKVKEYLENYQIVQVAPSIIPAYYSAIRVFEYNVSELVGQQFTRDMSNVERVNWTEWWADMDKEVAAERENESPPESYLGHLQLQDSDWAMLDDDEDLNTHEPSIQKKPKKPPPVHIPPGPHKSARPGPLFEPQLFTPLRWEVHFANLTEINAEYDKNPEKERNYKEFFKFEYASDDAPYSMKDLTIDSWLKLAREIGKEKKTSSVGRNLAKDAGDETTETDWVDSRNRKDGGEGGGKSEKGKKGKKEKEPPETYWDVFIRRAFVNTGHQLDFE